MNQNLEDVRYLYTQNLQDMVALQSEYNLHQGNQNLQLSTYMSCISVHNNHGCDENLKMAKMEAQKMTQSFERMIRGVDRFNASVQSYTIQEEYRRKYQPWADLSFYILAFVIILITLGGAFNEKTSNHKRKKRCRRGKTNVYN